MLARGLACLANISMSVYSCEGRHTIRMPHLARKPHCRRRKWIIFWELELGGEDTALKGRAFGALYQGFPEEEVVFGDRPGCDAVRRVVGEVLVFLEEALRGYCGCH